MPVEVQRMIRRILLALVALAFLAPAQSQAAYRSFCSHPIETGVTHACTVLYGPVMTLQGTAQPDEDGNASISLKMFDTVTGRVFLECSAEAFEAPASCSTSYPPELVGIAPTVFNNSNGNKLPVQCEGVGVETGSFSCSAGMR